MNRVITTVPVRMDMSWKKVAINLNVKVSFLYLLQNKWYIYIYFFLKCIFYNVCLERTGMGVVKKGWSFVRDTSKEQNFLGEFTYQIIVIVSQIFLMSKKLIGLVITWILVMVQLHRRTSIAWMAFYLGGSLTIPLFIHIFLWYKYCVCHPCKFIAFYYFSLDIDECAVNKSCHLNASCFNSPGSFNCTCSHGFGGDGYKFCLRKKAVTISLWGSNECSYLAP